MKTYLKDDKMDEISIIKDCEIQNIKEEALRNQEIVAIINVMASEVKYLTIDKVKVYLRKAGYVVD